MCKDTPFRIGRASWLARAERSVPSSTLGCSRRATSLRRTFDRTGSAGVSCRLEGTPEVALPGTVVHPDKAPHSRAGKEPFDDGSLVPEDFLLLILGSERVR